MRILVFEFITGGGLAGKPLPVKLAQEGEMMLQQVLRDFADCDAINSITILRDARLAPVSLDKASNEMVSGDYRVMLSAACRSVDMVLPIAPETGGALLEVSDLILAQGCSLLGSRPAAIRLTASKWQTAERLSAQDIPMVVTWTATNAPLGRDGDWVIKPDDGVGGERCRRVQGRIDLLPAGMILQPYLAGESASLNLLCADGAAVLYSCNRQQVQLDADGCRLHAIEVNALADRHAQLEPLAQAIAAALPDLWGWVGVDLVLGPNGPQVLEINPRMTTSYAGLRTVLSHNPAELLLDLQQHACLPPAMNATTQRTEVSL